MNKGKVFFGLFILTVFFSLFIVSTSAADMTSATPRAGTGTTSSPVSESIEGVTQDMEKITPYEFSGDLRWLPMYPLLTTPEQKPYRPLLRPPKITKTPGSVAEIPLSPFALIPSAPMPAAVENFAGMSFNDSCLGGRCGAGWPPDPNGDVGRNHYIQAVNDAYAIYDKPGTLLASFTEDQLWSVSGSNPCNGNSQGDPIVLYDQIADRWILTHFAFAFSSGNPVSPFYECIAVSKTSDPVSGGWWLYPLRMDPGGTGKPPVGTMNDYPKFGIWTDCLYMSANEFTMPSGAFAGTSFASFNKTNMYNGAALTWSLGFINNTSGPFTMIPANLSGTSLPPAGTHNYFVSESTSTFAFEVRKFTAGTNCGSGGSLSAPINVSHQSYVVPGSNTNIVPQPNTSNKLDTIDDRLMQKVQYRRVGGAESLWVVHSVQTSSGSSVSPQWAQINVTGGTIATTPVQQQIYSPDSSLYRWLGSLAVDRDGNMALGYSTSNGSAPNYPSIAYSGRLATDPLNSLPQTETQLIAGGGSQTNNCGGAPCGRWGDYSAMSVDPADDCTFWYINQYYSSQANGSSGNWQTRIGSFKFPSCGAGTCTFSILPTSQDFAEVGGTGSVSVTASAGCAWTAASNDAWITITGGSSGNGNGTVNYSVAANAGGARTGTLTIAGQTFTVNQSGAGGGTFSISGTVLTKTGRLPGVTMTLGGAGVATVTTDPLGNYLFTGLPNGAYTVTPGLIGYAFTPSSRAVNVNGSNVINQNFLAALSGGGTCTFSILPTSQNFASAGGTGSVSVTTAAGCAWTATSNAAWITITGGMSGSGSGTVNYSVAANSGGARTGTLTIAGQTFTVNQSGTGGGTFSISGTVLTKTSRLAGVTMTLSGAGSGSVTTDPLGNYTFTGLAAGTYTIMPFKAGYIFTPATRTVTISTGNITGQSFLGTPSP